MTSTATPVRTRTWSGEAGEADMVELLRHALASVEAPGEQFERLGIA